MSGNVITAKNPATSQQRSSSVWLTVIGIGDDGLASIGDEARRCLDEAEIVIGGERHLRMIPDHHGERLPWRQPLEQTLDDIEAHRGRHVVVLASGDPMWFGVGSLLARAFDHDDMRILPAVSSFSLVAARLGWSLNDVETLSLHREPPSAIRRHLTPGARLIVLTRNSETAKHVANLLVTGGFGPSRLIVFEHLGGQRERRIETTADDWQAKDVAALNTLAIECRAKSTSTDASSFPHALVPGLPDDAFESDGMLTKREVRATTLARLIPLPGQCLWDVGAGSGAIAIEWLRSTKQGKAIAIERDQARADRSARNAERLGTPDLRIICGEAPACFDEKLPAPDAIFIGGGISEPALLERCWQALNTGGRLVANVVTLDGERRLLDWQSKYGGDLIRMAVSRAEKVGPYQGWRPMMPVTQYAVIKP